MAETIKTKNVTTTLDLKTTERLSKLKNIVNKSLAQALGRDIKKLSLELVKIGKSPVKGQGRFKRYAVQRGGKSNYPETPTIRNKFPNKKTRPVNLFLDGSYLKAVTESKINKLKTGIEYGLLDGTDLQEKMFESHNEGKRSDIPQRKVVPTGKDEFTAKITRRIKDLYLSRIRRIIG